MSARRTLRAGALAMVGFVVGACVTGCPGLPCECDPDVMMLPTDLTTIISDIRVADWFDGGGGDEWAWHDQGSPWGEVLGGEIVLEGGELSIVYQTAGGTFRVALEEIEPQGWGGAGEWSP